jgi:hypothetical protein
MRLLAMSKNGLLISKAFIINYLMCIMAGRANASSSQQRFLRKD